MKKKKQKLKVLFYGDSPNLWTGFAQVLYNIIMELRKVSGYYDIKVFGIHEHLNINSWGLKPTDDSWLIKEESNHRRLPGDVQVIPGLFFTEMDRRKGLLNTQHSQDKFLDYVKHHEVDVIFILNDPLVVESLTKPLEEMRYSGKRFVTIYYFPIDTEYFLPHRFEIANYFDMPITYTKFGYKQAECFPEILKEDRCYGLGVPLQYIYHGINTKSFYPLPESQVKELRKGIFKDYIEKYGDDLFILLNLNRNQPRKDPTRTLYVFSEFIKSLKNDEDKRRVKLLMHMKNNDIGTNIINMIEYFDNLHHGSPRDEKNNVFLMGSYDKAGGNTVEQLNKAYNIADVGITTTLGEGWGLFTTECYATKTPVFVPNNTVHSEITRNGRLATLVDTNEYVFGYAFVKDDPPRKAVDVKDFVNKLNDCFYNKDKYIEKAEIAFSWIKKSFTWEKIVREQWIPVFKEAERLLEKQKQNFTQIEAIKE